MIILDTDVAIDLLRKYPPAVEWLSSIQDEEIVLSGYVAMELIQGCRDKVEQQKVKTILQNFRIIWPPAEVCNLALASFIDLRLGHGIGLLDMLIGQTAIYLNHPIHTFNKKHYSAVPNLKLIEPYKKN